MKTTSIQPRKTIESHFIERFCANNYNTCKSKQDLVLYYYHTCFFPTKTTWLKVIKNNFFLTWPGLTVKLVMKYLPKHVFTAKDSLLQFCKGVRYKKQDLLITKPVGISAPEENVQPTYSTIEENTDVFTQDHGSRKMIYLSNYKMR